MPEPFVLLEKLDVVTVILGQRGSNSCCGSGGTFVLKENGSRKKLILAAGGAGCSTDEKFGKGRFPKLNEISSQGLNVEENLDFTGQTNQNYGILEEGGFGCAGSFQN